MLQWEPSRTGQSHFQGQEPRCDPSEMWSLHGARLQPVSSQGPAGWGDLSEGLHMGMGSSSRLQEDPAQPFSPGTVKTIGHQSGLQGRS